MFWNADRTLFFDFASDTFCLPSVRGQLRCRSWSRDWRSRRVKIKQRAREGYLGCWPRLSRSRCATPLDQRNAISVACYKSCIIFASWDLLLQLRNWHVGLFHFFGRFILAQLISCFSTTAVPVAGFVNFPADKKLAFCRGSGRLLHVDEDATLLSVLRVALGDNESLNYTLRIFSPGTWRSRIRPAPCLFSHHRRKRSSGARAEEQEAQNSGLELVTHVWTWPTVQLNFGNEVLLAARQPVPEVPAVYKVEVGISKLRVKKF